MKEFKDAFISDNAYYFLIGYLNETDFEPIYRRHLEKYDPSTGRPQFHSEWLTEEQFFDILQEAVEYYKAHAEDITLDNIEKYGEK